MAKLPNNVIIKAGGRKYGLFRLNRQIDPDSGADILSYSDEPDYEVLAYIQPTGSQGSVKGVQLKNTSAGDTSIAEYFMYCNEPVKEKDRIIYNNILYEIRGVEPWESVRLAHYKCYLVKVDDQ